MHSAILIRSLSSSYNTYRKGLMFPILLTVAITAFVIVHYASIVEKWLHKNVMHKPILGFKYPFKAHALVHHQAFKADKTYHLVDETVQDKWTIPMAWWNGPVLVLIGSIPTLLIWLFLPTWELRFWMYGTTVAVIGAYYGTYEYIHWCMHLPRKRNIERSGLFFRLNGHHLLHHRYMNKNFNVVYPFADWISGTLLLRSKVRFAQARGPSVPDVQPV